MFKRWAIPDFETLSKSDLKKVGSYRYAEDPSTEVLVLCWAENDGPVQTWHPGDDETALRALLADDEIMLVAHNAPFERNIFEHCMRRMGLPVPPLTRWSCTLARCANLGLPLSLDQAGKALGLKFEKDLAASKFVIGLNKLYASTGVRPIISEAEQERIDGYCAGDVLEQRELHRRVGWLSPSERDVWLLNQRINDRGLCLDMPLVGAMQNIVAEASGPLAKEFAEITGGLKVGQIAKVRAWCNDRGVPIPDMKKETLADWLGDSDDEEESLAGTGMEEWEDPHYMPPVVERALKIRQLIGSSSIKKLSVMQGMVNEDSCAHGLLQYHGTGPGRETARLLQPHNFPKGTIKIGGKAPKIEPLVDALMTGDFEYVEMLYGPPVETVVSGLRHALVAKPGRVLVAGDYAGIQARTVLALAGQRDKTALMASGADVYVDMATLIFRRPIDKDRDPWERGIGKNSVLGLGFNMGAPTFQFKYAKDHPLEFCQGVVDTYRKEWAPEVPKVWAAFHEATLAVAQGRGTREVYGCEIRLEDRWLVIRLPSGRDMWYFDPKVARRRMPWSTLDKEDWRDAWTYKARKSGQFVTQDAFGGKTVENVVMGIERDLMVNAMHKMARNGFPICLEVHDEIVTEPLKPDADLLAFKQIMEEVPAWARGLEIPVAVETWANERYKK